ncbi:secreted RxLR effector protein 161-like [Malania oleifera]|uniref:secreted RxLR effector protein 161-like n=1 Tax=Malania oleifera TaxID=397392 RepID=UPI0025AECB2C|nr:secreted RxLR effector protein 161-like [Malania oleifera]
MKDVPYASVVGSLMYAQTCTRPDISFVVGMLSRYQSNPRTLEGCKESSEIQGIKDHKLMYRRSSHLEVVEYSDSDFAGCVDIRKSTFDYVYLLTGRAISWKSAKQSIIVASTMEAELVACFEVIVQAN